jgi:hypothetical protein
MRGVSKQSLSLNLTYEGGTRPTTQGNTWPCNRPWRIAWRRLNLQQYKVHCFRQQSKVTSKKGLLCRHRTSNGSRWFVWRIVFSAEAVFLELAAKAQSVVCAWTFPASTTTAAPTRSLLTRFIPSADDEPRRMLCPRIYPTSPRNGGMACIS